MHPMRVVGVRVELPANQPVVLLREEDGIRYLPIWIGAVEASAIAFQQQGVQTVRPLTHDLLRDVIAKDCRMESVSNNINRQFGNQQQEGFTITGSMSFQITLK